MTFSQNASHIKMRLTQNFHPINVAWSFLTFYD